jgi:branched-chain amino acid transport system ATP-binding protein
MTSPQLTGAVAHHTDHIGQSRAGRPGRRRPGELSVADARELAKALALQPRVLPLDEVLAGLSPGEIEPAMELIASLRGEGLALLMVEHVIRRSRPWPTRCCRERPARRPGPVPGVH